MSQDQKRIDNYKPLKFFQDNAPKTNTGFSKFSAGGEHYFAYHFGGKIVLISEGYKSEAGRDNGVESVKKNIKLEDRYQFKKHKNGKHYFDLLAGNRQEIATSVWFSSAKASKDMGDILMGKKTTNEDEVDNYHTLKFYESRISGVKNGFDKFEADDGHYFTYNQDGKIVLISEAYTSAQGRDNGTASVRKNMKLEERYDHRELKNGKHDFRLKAGNRQEIARSVWYGSAAAATAGAAALMGKKNAVSKSDREVDNYHPLAFYEPRISGVKDGFDKFEADDGHYFTYNEDGKIVLISEAYTSAKGRDNGIESVRKNMKIEERYDYRKLKNGKHDFRIKAGNNQEVARSVWYGSAAAAAGAAVLLMGKRKKPAAVVAAAPLAEPVAAAPAYVPPPVAVAAPAAAAAYVAPAAAGGLWGWLKWLLLGLLALLALFGLSKCFSPPPPPPPIPMVACWDGSEAESKAKCPIEPKFSCWDGSMAVNVAACPEKPPATLIDCWDGSKAENQAACPTRPKKQFECWDGSFAKNRRACPPENITPISGACSCGASSVPIFNISEYATAKSVTRLGTMPEFGDSHDLTPDQFYNKLAQRYDASSFDANYLDYVFRAMGYERGFSGATAADFTNQALPQGVKGILGFGPEHNYDYYQLNVTDPKDLQSFRIKSKNGCDVNFMKTCGNYMYTCGN